MASSGTVSQRKQIQRTAPRGFLKRVLKQRKPQLRLERSADLLIHLNCLLFIHRLAQESRMNACENKCKIIKKEHVLAAAKVILKKSRG
ncbi:centromere protein W [Sorex araneus]|uniref:centromere protein W n=1 Tax=Sorex araneus TaxID=42254 RepID=UPI0024336971|nr:centromere protein W [Sorex araneus]